MEDENFSLEMRGYKRDEVDRVLAELRAELEHVRDYNYTASAELEQVKNELETLKRKKTATQVMPNLALSSNKPFALLKSRPRSSSPTPARTQSAFAKPPRQNLSR